MSNPEFGPTARRTTPQFTPTQPAAVGQPVNLEPIRLGGVPTQSFSASGGLAGYAPVGGTSILETGYRPVAPLQQIAQRYDRPRSTFGMILRILRVGENLGAGFIRGTINSVKDVADSKNALEFLSGAAILASQGRGLIEMVKGVRDDLTYEELIAETANPGSWLYRHRRPIGIAASFFGDPTTYLSLGATGASKVAAKTLLARSWASSYDDALESLSRGSVVLHTPTGELIETGESIARSMDLDELAAKIHLDVTHRHLGKARPVSLGDAMNDVRAADRSRFGEGPLGTLRAVFPRGGQGIRFAGMKVPGTPALGERIGEGLGRGSKGVLTAKSLRDSFSLVIPNHKLHEITDDARRFLFMSEVQRVGQESVQIAARAQETGLDIFKLDESKMVDPSRPGYVRTAESVIRKLFVGDRPPYVPREVRDGMLRADYKAPEGWGNQAKILRMKTIAVRNAAIKDADAMGFDKNMIEDMSRLWGRLVDEFSDPVEVLSRFQMMTAAKLHTYRAIDELIRNPMFARIDVSKGADDLDKAFDELNDLQDKLFTARKRMNDKKLSAQQRGKAKRQVERLLPRYRSAQMAHAAIKGETKDLAADAGPRAVKGEEGAERVFHQESLPMRWRKDTYYVPAPIHDAIMEMRNPKFVETELRKAFRRMNWAQSKWKILATSVNPAFHVMNLMGGMWNNMLGGVYSPLDYLGTMADVYRKRSIEGKEAGFIPGTGLLQRLRPLQSDRLERATEDIAAFEARGAGGGLVHTEIQNQQEKLLRSTKDPSKSRQVFTAVRRTYGAAALSTLAIPDEWIPDEVEDALIPVVGAAAFLPELMRVGSKVANDVEDAVRLTPFRVAAKDKSYHQLIDAYSISPPSNFGKWMDQLDFANPNMAKEVTWDIGAAMALKYQFDYSNLTWTERYIAKTIFPFYTFYKNNFVLQVKEVVNRPRFINAFDTTAQASDALANYLEGGITDDENNEAFRELLPEYFDKLGMFRVPVPDFVRSTLGLPPDQPLYLNPKLPFASLNLFPPLWEMFNNDSVTTAPDRMLQALAPLFGAVGPFAGGLPFKPLLEYSVGYQLGLARPIDYQRLQSGGWRNSNTEAPGYAAHLPPFIQQEFGIFKDPNTGLLRMNSSIRYIMDQLASPFISGLGEPLGYIANTTESGRAAANTVSWMTGIRLTPVDPLRIQRGWLYRMENFLEGKAGEYKERGVPPPAEDTILLKQLRGQIRVIESAWDRRQAELYGRP